MFSKNHFQVFDSDEKKCLFTHIDSKTAKIGVFSVDGDSGMNFL